MKIKMELTNASDLMSRHHGEGGLAPLLARLVNVGVADPGILDLNRDVLGPDRTPGNLEFLERSVRLDCVQCGAMSWRSNTS